MTPDDIRTILDEWRTVSEWQRKMLCELLASERQTQLALMLESIQAQRNAERIEA